MCFCYYLVSFKISYMYITYDQEKGVSVVEGIKMGNQADNDKRVLMRCCDSLNKIIGDVAKQNDDNKQVPQDTSLSLQDAISRGIKVINNIDESLITRNYLNIAKLKKEFKKVLIQKKYNIKKEEISNNSNKFFRSDEKWWKRIKLGGSHLFSTKATINGQINRWFRQLVDYEGGTDIDLDKQFYELVQNNLDGLFKQLSDHKEAKEQKKKPRSNKRNNKLDKTIGLNTAFDDGQAIY